MLKHGILGLLNYHEMTGYEIKEVFAGSLNYFWTARLDLMIYIRRFTEQCKRLKGSITSILTP